MSLADRLKRAASGVVLNLAEAALQQRRPPPFSFESARGAGNEARAALALTCAWGYLTEAQVLEVDALYDRVLAMTYPLWARA